MSNPLGFEIMIAGPLDEAIETVTARLKSEGFGILTRIDVHATLKEKIGIDFWPYVILGACNPTLAHSALEADSWLGLLLPCNVTVESIDDRTSLVRIANPEMMAAFSQSPEKLSEIVKSASRKLNNVASALALA